MAIFEIEGPDGAIYEVDAPDEAAAVGAFQQMVGGSQQAVPDDVRDRWAAARNGTLQASQESLARHDIPMQTGQGFGNNAAQAAGDGLFMGFGDEISARLNAMTGYDANTGTYGNSTSYGDQLAAVRGQEKQFREDHPYVSTASEIGGAVLPAVAGVGVVSKGATALSRIGRGALVGGAQGGAYGFGEGEGGLESRAASAAKGAGIGLGLGAVTSMGGEVVRALMDGRATRKAIAQAAKGAPTSDELRSLGNALYRQVDDAGVQIKPAAFSDARQEIMDHLRANTGYDELPGPGSLTPNTARVMDIMRQADDTLAGTPTAALPFKSLDQMRRQAGAAAGNVTNKTDQAAGVSVIQQLDNFVQRLGPDDVVGGDPEALKSAITKARDVWSRMSKSQLVDDAMERSENYLSGSASGVRNQFKNILQNKKLAAGFSTAEKAALRSVTHGNALEQLVNLAGGGLAQMASIVGGLGAGGPAGALAGTAVAAGQRKLAEAVTMRSAERARAAIASGQLKNPEVLQALIGAGARPAAIANGAGFSASPAVIEALLGH